MSESTLPINGVTEILEKHPLATKKMVDWVNMGLEIADNDTRQLNIMLSYTPRLFYEFFDENNIYIQIEHYKDEWGYMIERHGEEMRFETREKAEEAAFIKAIEILENAESKIKPKTLTA